MLTQSYSRIPELGCWYADYLPSPELGCWYADCLPSVKRKVYFEGGLRGDAVHKFAHIINTLATGALPRWEHRTGTTTRWADSHNGFLVSFQKINKIASHILKKVMCKHMPNDCDELHKISCHKEQFNTLCLFVGREVPFYSNSMSNVIYWVSNKFWLIQLNSNPVR